VQQKFCSLRNFINLYRDLSVLSITEKLLPHPKKIFIILQNMKVKNEALIEEENSVFIQAE
jgi:hypothetical protein